MKNKSYKNESINRIDKIEKLYKTGYLDKAKEFCYKAIEENEESAFIYNRLGSIFARKKDYDKAEYFIQKALDIDENYKEAWNNLGALALEKGLLMHAKECFETAISIDANYYTAIYNLSIVFKKQNKIGKYIKFARKSERRKIFRKLDRFFNK